MSKRTRTIGPLALMPILALAGCGEDHPQRDIYKATLLTQAMDDCVEDWGSKDLCTEVTDPEQIKSIQEGQCNDEDEDQMQCVVTATDSHYVYGPEYMSRHRTVTHNSFVYIPMSSRASNYRVQPIGAFTRGVVAGAAARSFTSWASSSSRAVGAVSVSRGGFGSTGARVGSFSGS